MISLPFFKKREPEKIGIQAGYDLWSAHYARERNPVKSASDQSLKDMLPDLSGKSVLDAGCGAGYFCQYAEQANAKEVTGIDFSDGMINQAKQHCKRTKFITGEIQHVVLAEPVDVIICALVLGHIKDLRSALVTFSSNLKDTGLLALTDFHPGLSEKGQKRTFEWGKKLFEIPHYIHPPEKYESQLKEAGFTLGEIKDVKWKGLPLIFAVTARKIAS